MGTDDADSYVKGIDRTQELILPKTVDEYIDKENPVRFIDSFVDTLDMNSLGFTHSETRDVGRHPYNPSDLLKLYIHGYMKRMRSSRVLEDACNTSLETIWLMKGLKPDFKTIADFRKDNVDRIKSVFKQFVSFLQDIDLVGGEVASLDGSKFKACNARKRNFQKGNIESRLKRVEQRIERYMKKLEKNDELDDDSEEDDEYLIKKRNEYLRAKLEKIKKSRDELKEIQTELNKSGKDEISLTDPDSRLMKCNGRIDVCYNAELAVDKKEKLIVNYDVINEANDENQLFPMAKDTKEILGAEKLDVPADAGFANVLQIKECVNDGITPYIPTFKLDGSVAGKSKIPDPVSFGKDKFVYEEKRDLYVCPNGKEMRYRSTSIQTTQSGVVARKVYAAEAGVCIACPFKASCTVAKDARTITRWVHQALIDELIEKVENDPEKLDERVKLAEHPFATIKRALNQGYFLLRGLRKVKGEMGFTVLAYDIRRALNIMGTSGLLAALSMTAPTGGTANSIK
jgi:transposase